jgi:hypothetical protein
MKHRAAKRPVSEAYMFVFRNEITEETNDDLRYPRKQSLNSAPDYTKKIVAELSSRRNLRKKNVQPKTR